VTVRSGRRPTTRSRYRPKATSGSGCGRSSRPPIRSSPTMKRRPSGSSLSSRSAELLPERQFAWQQRAHPRVHPGAAMAKPQSQRCLDGEADLLGHAPRRQVANLGSPQDDLHLQMRECPPAAGGHGSRCYAPAGGNAGRSSSRSPRRRDRRGRIRPGRAAQRLRCPRPGTRPAHRLPTRRSPPHARRTAHVPVRTVRESRRISPSPDRPILDVPSRCRRLGKVAVAVVRHRSSAAWSLSDHAGKSLRTTGHFRPQFRFASLSSTD
jgi:hypothetical protein